MNETYLAFDLGAESGRGVLAEFDGAKITLNELGRFPTTSDSKEVGPDGVWRWDYRQITDHLKTILGQCEQQKSLSGVAVDTWGVDFGLLDRDGVLLEEPACYRDASHARAMEETLTRISLGELWRETGIQLLPFNTVFQIRAAQLRNPDLLQKASRLLFMPDLLASSLLDHPLTTSELTIASTSQMLDPAARTWNQALLGRLGLPTHFLQPIVQPGAFYGKSAGGTSVWATAGHDTACAVAAAPATSGKKWAFLSSGTWSLLGVERSQPALSDEALRMKLSNEIGVLGTTRLLKNIAGLWLVQECRRSLARAGEELSYGKLTAMAAGAPANGPMVDGASTRFLAPADMPTEIRTVCSETGQKPPEDTGALIRCCLDSLALAYRRTLIDLRSLLGERYEVLHIVGGGTQNRLLNQLAADACGIPVVTGPVEATAVGNVLAQMIGRGVLANWEEARQVCRNSFEPETYLPNADAHEQWMAREQEILKKGVLS